MIIWKQNPRFFSTRGDAFSQEKHLFLGARYEGHLEEQDQAAGRNR
jgi:hypothetical protein